MQEDMQEDKGNGRKVMKKAGKIIGMFFGYLFTTVLLFLFFVIFVILFLIYGPSEEARDIFIHSCQETSAMKFLPYWFMDDAEVDEILFPSAGSSGPSRKAPMLQLGFSDALDFDPEEVAGLSEEDKAELGIGFDIDENREVTVEEVNEGIYRGMMMIIPDPSRVVIGTLPNYSTGGTGKLLPQFIEDYGAIGGTNAGGFYDPDGRGAGGCPEGLVIENSTIRYGDDRVYVNVIAFDENHRLILGNWSPKQALEAGAVSAVSFTDGLVLVKDGVPSPDQRSGVNPRTAIGQRADGTVLLLVIEGRHAGSLGATADDLRDIFVRYGAENASMLDGGTSAVMFFKGEQITRGSNLLGMRALPTAILVMPSEDEK